LAVVVTLYVLAGTITALTVPRLIDWIVPGSHDHVVADRARNGIPFTALIWPALLAIALFILFCLNCGYCRKMMEEEVYGEAHVRKGVP